MLTTVITLVWVANFVAGVFIPDWSPAAINGIFALVVGILYRSFSKKAVDDEPEPETTPKRDRRATDRKGQ